MMDKFLLKPEGQIDNSLSGRFEIYNLSENPFPSTAIVNKDSEEKKSNGSIYEAAVRKSEYDQILQNFLKVPQKDPNHLRLGFILDTSYIGRGNGKSTFIINIQREINKNYCYDISNKQNKWFAVYLAPEGGGKIKTFEKFVDALFDAIINSNIINECLAILKYQAITNNIEKYKVYIKDEFKTEKDFVEKLNSDEWYDQVGIYRNEINDEVQKNIDSSSLSFRIPRASKHTNFVYSIVKQTAFREHYYNLKSSSDRYEFFFTDLVNFFIISGFNGAYLFIDDFERIPDFQSAIQKKDFSTQLRTVLFDGLYKNSRIGFFNFIMALHAGVPRLMEEAWSQAGLDHRVSMVPSYSAKHIISFGKLEERQVVLLLQKYLNEYRVNVQERGKELFPFDKAAISKMGSISEMNAAKILQLAHNIIDYGAEIKSKVIDIKFLTNYIKEENIPVEKVKKEVLAHKVISLTSKAKKKNRQWDIL